jgi:hypothetical protein
MPQVIDQAGNLRQLTDAQYEAEARKWVEAERAPELAKVHREGPEKVRLWDVVDGGWTKPFDRRQAFEQFLRLEVLRCTACTYTSVHSGQVGQHIETVRKHHNVRPEPDSEGTERCPACDARARPGTIRQHIMTMQAATFAHQSAREVKQRRYALEPSVPVVAVPVAAIPVAAAAPAGPHGTEVERRQATRPRRRRRRHSRGGQ